MRQTTRTGDGTMIGKIFSIGYGFILVEALSIDDTRDDVKVVDGIVYDDAGRVYDGWAYEHQLVEEYVPIKVRETLLDRALLNSN